MSVECPRSSLKIPKDVVSISASIEGHLYTQPIWTFARHRNGCSLKAESSVRTSNSCSMALSATCEIWILLT